MRAKDRPLANDFVSEADFDRMLTAWFGNMARVLEPGRGFYIWGGYANCANYPPVLKAQKLYFSQAIIWDKEHPVLTRKDFMGNHEWCFYGWKEGAAHSLLRARTTPWTCGSVKKVNPNRDGPPDGEARRVGRAGDAVLLAGGRERAGPVRRQRQHADRRRADRAQSVPDGTGRALLRCHRPTLGEVHRQEGHLRESRGHN